MAIQESGTDGARMKPREKRRPLFGDYPQSMNYLNYNLFGRGIRTDNVTVQNYSLVTRLNFLMIGGVDLISGEVILQSL